MRSYVFAGNFADSRSQRSHSGKATTCLMACGATERWRKPTPSCNGADRSCNITPPRKRADFQHGSSLRKNLRTFKRGKQMNVDSSMCASSGQQTRRLPASIVKAMRQNRCDRLRSRRASERLEPDEGKLSRPVQENSPAQAKRELN